MIVICKFLNKIVVNIVDQSQFLRFLQESFLMELDLDIDF